MITECKFMSGKRAVSVKLIHLRGQSFIQAKRTNGASGNICSMPASSLLHTSDNEFIFVNLVLHYLYDVKVGDRVDYVAPAQIAATESELYTVLKSMHS